jgi:hypothetical protein
VDPATGLHSLWGPAAMQPMSLRPDPDHHLSTAGRASAPRRSAAPTSPSLASGPAPSAALAPGASTSTATHGERDPGGW